MGRCIVCSDGHATVGDHCDRCRPHTTTPRTPAQLDDLRRAELVRTIDRLEPAAARDPHYQPDLDRARAELEQLDARRTLDRMVTHAADHLGIPQPQEAHTP